jgi:uncharacterized protein (TIGR02271 family)
MVEQSDSEAGSPCDGARVLDAEGGEGRVVSVRDGLALIATESGPCIAVPVELLVQRPDETWTVPFGLSSLAVPVVEEQATVRKRSVERGGVRLEKRVTTRTERIEPELRHEQIDVERVPMDEPVDAGKLAPWQEGDTWVFPVVEEVLVVSKQLRLKEQVRVTRRQRVDRARQEVELRREEIDVRRFRR